MLILLAQFYEEVRRAEELILHADGVVHGEWIQLDGFEGLIGGEGVCSKPLNEDDQLQAAVTIVASMLVTCDVTRAFQLFWLCG